MSEEEKGNGTGGSEGTQELRREVEETRQQLADTVEALSAKTDVRARARDAAGDAAERVIDSPPVQSAQSAAVTARRNPLPIVAGALAAGLLVGWLVIRR